MLLGGNGLVTWAEQRVPSGLAALIVASVPIWMTVLDALHRRERPHGVVLLGLAIGLAGIAFLVAPGRFAGGGHVDPLGAAALLTAALMWAIGSLYARRAKLPSSTLLATAMEMIAGGTILLLTSGLVREWKGFSLAAVSPRSALALGYLIVAGSLLGFSAYVFLLRATTPARVSTYAYVNPIVAVLLGWAILGEVADAPDPDRRGGDRRGGLAHHPTRGPAPRGAARGGAGPVARGRGLAEPLDPAAAARRAGTSQ